MPMREVHLLVDRSRMVDYRNCPRLRYLRYHALGTGLSAKGVKEALALGDAAHKVVQRLWAGEPVEPLLDEYLAPWRGTPIGAALWLALRSWAHYRLPPLMHDYDVVFVERELLWELGRQQEGETLLLIEDMIRVDALLRSRLDGGLYYFELKTTGSGGLGWATQWEHNTQVLINTLALEELLGERVEGVLIEGLLKDERWGYGYERRETGDRSFAYCGKKGWEKVLIAEPAEWWPTLDEGDWASVCLPVPPIRPIPAQLERKRRQLVAQEVAIWRDLDSATPLDVAFPHHDEHCRRFFRHPCEMEGICWTKAIGDDPLGSGLYERRVPHHESEKTHA